MCYIPFVLHFRSTAPTQPIKEFPAPRRRCPREIRGLPSKIRVLRAIRTTLGYSLAATPGKSILEIVAIAPAININGSFANLSFAPIHFTDRNIRSIQPRMTRKVSHHEK